MYIYKGPVHLSFFFAHSILLLVPTGIPSVRKRSGLRIGFRNFTVSFPFIIIIFSSSEKVNNILTIPSSIYFICILSNIINSFLSFSKVVLTLLHTFIVTKLAFHSSSLSFSSLRNHISSFIGRQTAGQVVFKNTTLGRIIFTQFNLSFFHTRCHFPPFTVEAKQCNKMSNNGDQT